LRHDQGIYLLLGGLFLHENTAHAKTAERVNTRSDANIPAFKRVDAFDAFRHEDVSQ
jgi:hypothetical protein